MINNIIKKGNMLILNNRIKLIGESANKVVFEVLDEYDECKHNVVIQTKKGATIITCDCVNCSRNCNSPNICYNKWAVLKFYEMGALGLLK